jgi:hypothetical protein
MPGHYASNGHFAAEIVPRHSTCRHGGPRLPEAICPAEFVLRCTSLQQLKVRFRHFQLMRSVIDYHSVEGLYLEFQTCQREKRSIIDGIMGLVVMSRLPSVRPHCMVTLAQWLGHSLNICGIVASLVAVIEEELRTVQG